MTEVPRMDGRLQRATDARAASARGPDAAEGAGRRLPERLHAAPGKHDSVYHGASRWRQRVEM